MQSKRWMMRWGPAILTAVLALSAYGLGADFEPSTYNPAVGEIVTFAVCESCLGAGTYTYAWDFTGDGTPDLETQDPWVTHAFNTAGYHEVGLKVLGAGGRTRETRKGIVVGDTAALGVRSLVRESDGSILVLVRVDVHAIVSGVGVEENLTPGWMVEIVDARGAMSKHDAERRCLQVVWASLHYPGESVVLSYRLRPGYASTLPSLYGEVQGYIAGRHFAIPVAGVLQVPEL